MDGRGTRNELIECLMWGFIIVEGAIEYRASIKVKTCSVRTSLGYRHLDKQSLYRYMVAGLFANVPQ